MVIFALVSEVPVNFSLLSDVILSEFIGPRSSETATITGGAGGVASMVQVCVAGIASVLPAASVALTLNECVPSARFVKVAGLLTVANAAPSKLASYVTPVSLLV